MHSVHISPTVLCGNITDSIQGNKTCSSALQSHSTICHHQVLLSAHKMHSKIEMPAYLVLPFFSIDKAFLQEVEILVRSATLAIWYIPVIIILYKYYF